MGAIVSSNQDLKPSRKSVCKALHLSETQTYLEKIFYKKFILTLLKSDHLNFKYDGLIIPISEDYVFSESIMQYLKKGLEEEVVATIYKFQQELKTRYKSQYANLIKPDDISEIDRTCSILDYDPSKPEYY